MQISRGNQYIIQINDDWVCVFVRTWMNLNKPCSLLLRQPTTVNTTAIVVNIENDEAVSMISGAKEMIENNMKIYESKR